MKLNRWRHAISRQLAQPKWLNARRIPPKWPNARRIPPNAPTINHFIAWFCSPFWLITFLDVFPQSRSCRVEEKTRWRHLFRIILEIEFLRDAITSKMFRGRVRYCVQNNYSKVTFRSRNYKFLSQVSFITSVGASTTAIRSNLRRRNSSILFWPNQDQNRWKRATWCRDLRFYECYEWHHDTI